MEYNKRKATTISVVSGKGGVGKTSYSIILSKVLASKGKKVLLIDCDYNLSNILVKLNLTINDDFYDLVTLKKEFKDCLRKFPNFHILPGCNGNVNLSQDKVPLDDIFLDIINDCENDYDYIILDSPAGMDDRVLSLSSFCDDRIFVINPDKSSVTDSYSLMKVLKVRHGVKFNYFSINKYDHFTQLERVRKTLLETCDNFLGVDLKFIGGVKNFPVDPEYFDKNFIQNNNDEIKKTFIKIVDTYSEGKDVVKPAILRGNPLGFRL
jgi:flagellar biosynthesis protein FlhG